jgi:hypothetical protein
MTILILILSLILLFLSIFGLTYYIKYKKLNKKVDKIVADLKKPLRQGYYIRPLTYTNKDNGDKSDFDSIIFVRELDRFTNGESKIEIEGVDSGTSKVGKEVVESFIRDEFKSIVKSDTIEWLESEQSIKEIRKNKLAQLKEHIKEK